MMPTMTALLNEEALILRDNLSKLPQSKHEFAQSLIDQQLKGNKPLSEKQAFWLSKLYDMALNPPPPPKVVDLGVSVAGIIALFDTAGSKLKYPQINIEAADVPLVLSRAGPTARVPGSVNVKRRNDYGENDWLGRVTKDGQWQPSRKADDYPFLEDFLTQFAENPAKVAADFGKKSGRCCFCNLKLSDARSVFVGYGRTCAGHFGLPYPSMSDVKGKEFV